MLKEKTKDESIQDQFKEVEEQRKIFNFGSLQDDCDKLQNVDGEFAYSANNPVPVNGVCGSFKYINRLRCKCGVGLMFHRLGSIKVDNIEGNVDAYETVCISGKHWDILFLHMYHPRRSTIIPANYSFADFHPIFSKISIAFGTNRRTRNFPFDLSDQIIRHFGDGLGNKIAAKYEEIIKDKSKFQRPQDHQKKLEDTLKQIIGHVPQNQQKIKQVYKVLIKGPWDGIKEDYWELSEDIVKKFGDENNIVHIICTYKKGEPEYDFITKRIWEKLYEIGQIIDNQNFSAEQQSEEFKKLFEE